MGLFENTTLYEAVAQRFDETVKRPVSVEFAKYFWQNMCELLCFQLCSQGSKDPSLYPNNNLGRFGNVAGAAAGNSGSVARNPNRAQSASPSTRSSSKYHGARIVVPNFAAFVKVAAESSSCLPTVVFVPNDGFCESYNCKSKLMRWRVSGAVRTHEINMRELARRVDRTVDDATRILQGFISIVGDACESAQTVVKLSFPTVGELTCERRNVAFAFSLRPDPEFTMLLSSVARERPPRPTTAGQAHHHAPGVEEHEKENEPEEALLANKMGAAVEKSIHDILSKNDAPELQRLEHKAPSNNSCLPPRPSSSSAAHRLPHQAGDDGETGSNCYHHHSHGSCGGSSTSGILPYRRPASSQGAHQRRHSLPTEGSHDLDAAASNNVKPLNVNSLRRPASAASSIEYGGHSHHAAAASNPSLASLSGGGRFAAAKARKHQVQNELNALQNQARSRLISSSPARLPEQYRPSSRAGSEASHTAAMSTAPSSSYGRMGQSSALSTGSGGTLLGISAGGRRSAFRQPSPVALEAAMESAYSRQREAIIKAKMADEKFQHDSERYNAVANLAANKHGQRVKSHNRSVQSHLTEQVKDKTERTKSGMPSTISQPRNTKAFEKDTLQKSRWSQPSNPHQLKLEKAKAYKASLDTQLNIKNTREQHDRDLEKAVDRENTQLMTELAIERFKEEEYLRRETQSASRAAWQSQLDLKYM